MFSEQVYCQSNWFTTEKQGIALRRAFPFPSFGKLSLALRIKLHDSDTYHGKSHLMNDNSVTVKKNFWSARFKGHLDVMV